jgi:putative PIN family toxin of toxin-antitoxin system
VVLDTSVFVAAALSAQGGSARLLTLWLEEARLGVIVSPQLMTEVQRVLSRPRFQAHLQPGELTRLLTALARRGEQWPDPATPVALSRDPADDYLPALALGAGAEALVSLDDDLLSLGRVGDAGRSLPVLTPGALLALLRQAGLLRE